MSQIIIDQTIAFIKEHHKDDISGHGSDHVMRVYQNICTLLESAPNANAFVCKMAALLHDVDDYKLLKGEPKTPAYLESLDLDADTIKLILETIDQTGFSKAGANPDFDSEEADLLSDADKLDAIGAIGILRVIQYNASINREVFDVDIFPKENLTKEEYKDRNRKENTAINHFFDKLLRLKGAMQTEAGKQEAEKRQQTMVMFLESFFREQNAEGWQEYLDNFLKKLS